MLGPAALGDAELWYTFLDEQAVPGTLPARDRTRALAIVAQAWTRTNLQVLAKMSELGDGTFRVRDELPVGIGNPDSITRRRRDTRESARRADPVGERRAD